MQHRHRQVTIMALVGVSIASNSGCIMVTQRYALVDFNRPHGILNSATSEGIPLVIGAAVAMSMVFAATGWLVYHRLRSRLREPITAAPPIIAREERKPVAAVTERPVSMP